MNAIYKKHIVVWSDNCAAQNKNRMIIFIYIFLISCGILDVIEHKFLVSGHSFLQCDRDFALIEKRKKNCQAIIPDHLHEIRRSSTRTGKFEVLDMCKQKFFDLQKAADEVINLKQVKISKVVHIKIESKHPHIILTKDSYSDVCP